MKKLWIALIYLFLVTACDNRPIPKSQDGEGNCKQSFVDAYNKVASTNFDVLPQADTKAQTAAAENCKAILKTYGANSEACMATNLKTGEPEYLSTKDLKENCAKTIQNKFFGTESESKN